MPLNDAYVQDVEARLSKLSPALVEPFRASLAALPAELADERARLLAEEAVALAGHSMRSWEACGDYFRVAPQLV
jgi:surfactin synthase thioesterase subunit